MGYCYGVVLMIMLFVVHAGLRDEPLYPRVDYSTHLVPVTPHTAPAA